MDAKITPTKKNQPWTSKRIFKSYRLFKSLDEIPELPKTLRPKSNFQEQHSFPRT
jgi:hypothetical protein